MPLLRHFEHLGHARFVTFSTYNRVPFLTTPESRNLVTSCLGIMREKHGIRIFAYVIMPDHIHLLIHPLQDRTLTIPLMSFKQVTTKLLYSRSHPEVKDTAGHLRLWQHRGYDHNCRNTFSVIRKMNYCHQNPVKAGLATRASEWGWSSARWYEGCRDVLLPMDEMLIEDPHY